MTMFSSSDFQNTGPRSLAEEEREMQEREMNECKLCGGYAPGGSWHGCANCSDEVWAMAERQRKKGKPNE